MLDVYLDQLNFGVLDKELFDAKSRKAVELTQITKDSLYEKYSKSKERSKEIVRLEAEVDKYKQQAEGYLATSADFHNKLMKETEKNEQLTNDMLAKDDLVQDLKYKLAQKENEIANLKVVEAPAVVEAKVEPVKVERKIERKIVKEPKEQEFSSAVDEKAKEVEALL
jgi:predicted S18 family serine protease